MLACDRLQREALVYWTGGDFMPGPLAPISQDACAGCAFQGSLRLNMLGGGWRAMALYADTAGRELRDYLCHD